MSSYVLPFEQKIVALETKLSELRSSSENQDIDVSSEIKKMEEKIKATRADIYKNLNAWQKVQLARHPKRPYTQDYIAEIFDDYSELHGDRIHRDDQAIIGGFAKLNGQPVLVLGTQKGRDTKSNLICNFGCPYPEGYRKALRLMRLAAKFKRPIITFIDTSGAYPGVESEERHVAEAIAVNLREMFTFGVPIIAIVIGEGGSGGALGIGIGNRILMLEHAYYSVISPEGCAAILWKDRSYADKAAEALKCTAQHLLEAKLCDQIIPEPLGGAHHSLTQTAADIKTALENNLKELSAMTPQDIMDDRYKKFRAMGEYNEKAPKKSKKK